MKSLLCLIVGLLIATPGCGQGDRVAYKMAKEGEKKNAPADALDAPAPAQNIAGKVANTPALERKIKYTADIRLITDDFDKSRTDLLGLIEKNKGFVAKSDLSISPGTPKSGVWRVRIPMPVFNPFCEEVQKIGKPEKFSTNSEDVTEDFYDTQRHIEIRQKSLNNLEKRRDKAEKDALDLYDSKIDKAETEIYRLQGHLNVLTNLTDLTTVTVTINERQKFNPDRPPEIVEKPDFATAAGKAFGDSFDALKSFGRSIVLLLISLSPWLALILALGLPLWLVSRFLRRNK